jgi:hypothetical protein
MDAAEQVRRGSAAQLVTVRIRDRRVGVAEKVGTALDRGFPFRVAVLVAEQILATAKLLLGSSRWHCSAVGENEHAQQRDSMHSLHRNPPELPDFQSTFCEALNASASARGSPLRERFMGG